MARMLQNVTLNVYFNVFLDILFAAPVCSIASVRAFNYSSQLKRIIFSHVIFNCQHFIEIK